MFVPERTKNTENPVHNGYRFVIDKRRDDSSYWKFSDFRKGFEPESQQWKSSFSMDRCRGSKLQSSIRTSNYLSTWLSIPTMKIPGSGLQPHILSILTTCGPARCLPADDPPFLPRCRRLAPRIPLNDVLLEAHCLEVP